MNQNLTEIIFILDRSGSMCNIANDTIGGYNSFLENQKQEEGEALITTILFDDQYEVLHDGVNIKDVKPLTKEDYYARGCTALLDAIGKTINNVGARLSNLNEEERPSKVVFVITTDGEENSSREFNKSKIKDMITHQQDKYNWQFLFLGANIDAVGEATSLGISSLHASNYTADSIGTQSIYTSLSKGISNLRCCGDLSQDWNNDIK